MNCYGFIVKIRHENGVTLGVKIRPNPEGLVERVGPLLR